MRFDGCPVENVLEWGCRTLQPGCPTMWQAYSYVSSAINGQPVIPHACGPTPSSYAASGCERSTSGLPRRSLPQLTWRCDSIRPNVGRCSEPVSLSERTAAFREQNFARERLQCFRQRTGLLALFRIIPAVQPANNARRQRTAKICSQLYFRTAARQTGLRYGSALFLFLRKSPATIHSPSHLFYFPGLLSSLVLKRTPITLIASTASPDRSRTGVGLKPAVASLHASWARTG